MRTTSTAKKRTTTGTAPSTAQARASRASRARLDSAVAKAAGISRERAQALILAGKVTVDGLPQRKAGFAVPASAAIDILHDQPYVSRGGLKLERALRAFGWSPLGLRCLDVGASTGGFTDCLLQHGASSVTAVDVGYGHLAWKLRQDPRVSVVERTNFRHADVADLGAPFDFVSADVSFISLRKLSAQFAAALAQDGHLVALVKPQFEAGRAAVQRGGVVRDPSAHCAALDEVIASFTAAGLAVTKLTYSPLKGPAGNIEFLLGAQRDGLDVQAIDVAGVVRQAHETLE
ncbi:MAG: TlyA family RNA methyltransferase [Candidatus Eremiobacteraeota bacterium]|nr:TlyA family RNA methyltransferase [Candidatus Eremiobacteraeota bacterium]